LFSEGKKITSTPYTAFYVINAGETEFPLLFGTGVSARNFRKAVDRNKIKRLTREAWRLQKAELHEKLKTINTQMHVFLIYGGKDLPDYKKVYDKVGSILKKLEKLVQS
jgi:ribonuclease P protein component